jgi:hypothetical protein
MDLLRYNEKEKLKGYIPSNQKVFWVQKNEEN